MVPGDFVILEALARTPNGKLDRKALPAPSVDALAPREGSVAPRTPTEEVVMGVFHKVLGGADFGVFDDFYELGDHAVMAARLVSQPRDAAGLDVPLRNLFQPPPVAALPEGIDALAWFPRARPRQAAIGENRVE